MRFGELLRRKRARLRVSTQNLPLPHSLAAPESIENLVEALPVGMRGAEQRAQCRHQRCWVRGGGRRKDDKRIAFFRKTDAKAIVSQCADEAGEPAARPGQRHPLVPANK